MTDTPLRTTATGMWAVVVARAGTVLIDVCAFWLSATTLTDLARRAGIDPMQAWMWPVIVDGMIVVATVAIVALARHGTRSTVYPWTLLIACAAVSVTANCMHALVATNSDLPPQLAASVAAVPPLVLLAATHLTVQLGRRISGAARKTTTSHDATPPPLSATVHTNSPHPDMSKPPAATTAAVSPLQHSPVLPTQQQRLGQTRPTERSRTAPLTTPIASSSDARNDAVSLSRQGLSTSALAARLHVHPSTVGRWLAIPGSPAPNTADTANHGGTSRSDVAPAGPPKTENPTAEEDS